MWRSLARPEWVCSALLFGLFLGIWEVAVAYLEIPSFLLPPPSAIWVSLKQGLSEDFSSRVGFYLHTYYTLAEAMLGFLMGSVAGILLGTLIAQSQFVGRVLLPYMVAFQSLPKVALAPLLIVWFGVGMSSKVAIVGMLTFFPLLINSIAGFNSVDRNLIELMRSLGASRWQVFFKVRLPSALPFIFAGLSMAIVYSLIGAIVGEFIGGRYGLGILILQMNFNMDTQGVFSVFVVLSIIGVGLYLAMRWIERKLVFWTSEGRDVIGL